MLAVSEAQEAALPVCWMTPASPAEPKTRQGKQARVMTLSGPITQNALSIFIPHHSHIILINHLLYEVFYSLWKL